MADPVEKPDISSQFGGNRKKASEKLRTLKKHARGPQEEESESNWLMSYADMMTLLVGFFVMLLAFSSLDFKKYEKLKQETTKVFGGEYKVPFEEVSKTLKDVVKAQKLQDQVVFEESEEGITITFRGALFFASGSSELQPKALNLLEKVVPVIQKKGKNFGIIIEGHTDDSPIVTKRFPSNWELSSVRACTVLRLFEENGFPSKKMQALGWGDTKPIVPNRDENGVAIPLNRAQNRRVVIRVLKDTNTQG